MMLAHRNDSKLFGSDEASRDRIRLPAVIHHIGDVYLLFSPVRAILLIGQITSASLRCS